MPGLITSGCAGKGCKSRSPIKLCGCLRSPSQIKPVKYAKAPDYFRRLFAALYPSVPINKGTYAQRVITLKLDYVLLQRR